MVNYKISMGVSKGKKNLCDCNRKRPRTEARRTRS